MRGGLRWACSLVIALTLAGCAGSSWQFWKSSESAEPHTSPSVAGTPATDAPVTAAPAPTSAPTATPMHPVETAVVLKPSANGFAALPALGDVRFRSGQVGLAKTDVKHLDTVVRWLKEHPGAQVLVEGHTDDLGTREENLAVGEKRAVSVMRYLVSKGLEPTRISTVSVGSERPLCTDKTDTCRAKNRRARFLVKQP